MSSSREQLVWVAGKDAVSNSDSYRWDISCLTGASERGDAAGQLPAVRDDLSAVQPPGNQTREGVTLMLRPQSLSAEGGARHVVEGNLETHMVGLFNQLN